MTFEEPTPEDPIKIILGDTREVLKTIPDETFQCCVTSPPYWGVRDYGVKGQIGAPEFEDELIFEAVSPDGMCRAKIVRHWHEGEELWFVQGWGRAGRVWASEPFYSGNHVTKAAAEEAANWIIT